MFWARRPVGTTFNPISPIRRSQISLGCFGIGSRGKYLEKRGGKRQEARENASQFVLFTLYAISSRMMR